MKKIEKVRLLILLRELHRDGYCSCPYDGAEYCYVNQLILELEDDLGKII